MKHTPGPWVYEKATKTIRSAKNNYWLATMDSWDGQVDNDANARLIAAAPELLEACHKLLDMITDNRTHGPEVYFAAEAIAAAYSVIFSVKYSTDKGKTIQEESGFKTGNDAQNFAWTQHRKGAVIYGLYKNGKII